MCICVYIYIQDISNTYIHRSLSKETKTDHCHKVYFSIYSHVYIFMCIFVQYIFNTNIYKSSSKKNKMDLIHAVDSSKFVGLHIFTNHQQKTDNSTHCGFFQVCGHPWKQPPPSPRPHIHTQPDSSSRDRQPSQSTLQHTATPHTKL